MISKFAGTHMKSIFIESEAWVMGALAAEGGLEERSLKFRSENTDGCCVTNGEGKAVPDLRASGAEAAGRDNRF